MLYDTLDFISNIADISHPTSTYTKGETQVYTKPLVYSDYKDS